MTNYTGAKPIPSPWFAVKGVCAECGKRRGTGSHAKCSRIRQAKFSKENGARHD